jgi:hypothetical protein
MKVAHVRMEANQEKWGAMDLETNPEETEAIVEHQEIFNKEDSVETVGALKDRSSGQELAMGYQNPLRKWTKNGVVQGTPKGWTLGMRHHAQPKHNSIRN